MQMVSSENTVSLLSPLRADVAFAEWMWPSQSEGTETLYIVSFQLLCSKDKTQGRKEEGGAGYKGKNKKKRKDSSKERGETALGTL